VRRALAAMVLLAAGRAWAQPTPDTVTLIVDGQPRGEVIVLVDDDDAIWLPAAALCELRLCRTGGLERDGVRYLKLASLGDSVSARLDRDAGELRLHLDSEALEDTTIALGGQRPADLERASSPSLFVNYALLGDARTAAMEHFTVGGAAEAGLSLGGTLAYSAMTVVDTTHVVRGLTSYTVDWRAKLVRFVAGDEVVAGGTLGGGGVIGGLHVARDFSIDPYFIAQPTLTQTGVVSQPSTIEVYRDGQLIRREVVPAGPYRVEDFAGTSGADTKIIVRDAFGLTRATATSMIAPPATALRPGLSMFDYAIGFARTLGAASFDYPRPALLAVHRLGITNLLTLGARAEATLDRASGGASAVLTRGRIALEATAAASASSLGGSGAAALTLGWHRHGVSLAALVRAVGDHYTTIDLAPEVDRAVAETELTASWSITPRATVLLQGAAEHMRSSGDRVRGGVTTSLQLGDARLFVSADAARLAALWTVEASATLAWSWGERTTATSSASAGTTQSVAASLSRAMPAGTGVGYQLTAATGTLDRATARGVAQGDVGRVEVAGEWINGAGHAGLALSGGLVAIGGTVKPTRAVQGGFALVRVAESAGVRTYLDNQPIGRTDGAGELVLPELQANYGNRIRVDARDLPLDVSTQALERTIAPPRRGGVVVELSPRRTAIARGTIHGVRAGAPFDVSYGELVIDRAIAAPIGHAGAFEVEAVAPGRHHGVITVDGVACELELEIPPDRPVIDAGTLTCQVTR
jgi:outer membrane usher protein